MYVAGVDGAAGAPRRLGRVIATDVLERVLAGAVSTGADFAEVYAEDKRSTSAGLDDGKVEQVSSGRDRGAGIRVVAGDTTGFAYTSDLSEPGLVAAASCGRGRGESRRWRGSHRRAHGVGATPAEHRRAGPRFRRQGRQGRAARTHERGRPVVRAGDRAGVGRLRRQPQAGPRRQHRRRPRRRRGRPNAAAHQRRGRRRHRHADRLPVDGAHGGLRDLRHRRRGGTRPRGRPAGDHEAARPARSVGSDAGRDQARHRRRALPRGVRPRLGGRPHPEGCERLCRQGRPAGRRRRS